MKEVETDHEMFADLLPRRMSPKRRRESMPLVWEWGHYNHIDDDWNFFNTLEELVSHLAVNEQSTLAEQISFNKDTDSKIVLKRRGDAWRAEDEVEVTITGLPEVMERGHSTPKSFVGQVGRALHLRTVGAP
jgi:hypothetical protein